MAWSLNSNSGGAGAELLVDTNGAKNPNKYGRDRFVLLPLRVDAIPKATMTASELTGLPEKILPHIDSLSANSNSCPSGDTHPCYCTSWLLE